ncbi:MAG TPA: HipA domain-containing protein, partial [Wenzhouxiangella sp.]|nr:HipA domain-containing protein [Wenzhouxiangella sp.]
MSDRRLTAWWDDGTRIGHFSERDDDAIDFEYADDYRGIPVSVSLPPGEKAAPRAAANFLANLLPESESARSRIARRHGLDPNDNFGLLSTIGRECAGALILTPDDDTPPILPGQYSALSDADFERWLEMREHQPLMTDREGRVRLSLAGAQAKAALRFDESDRPWLPLDGAASTHIVKPRILRARPDTVHVEWFCMHLAAAMLADVDVATTDLWRRCLRVKRFDRQITESGVRRVHQEDLCQALGLAPTAKYERVTDIDGPQDTLLARTTRLIDTLARAGRMPVPALVKRTLYRYLLVNAMLLNADAHLMNFALLHLPDGRMHLAPLYDVLCTEAIRMRAGNETGWEREPAREVRLESELALAIGKA